MIAHRGNNKEALENSFEAFDLALACGAHRVELDIHMSLDKTVYVCHDALTNRVSMEVLNIQESHSEKISGIHLLNGQKVPTLSEVLERYLDRIELNIEIKGHDPSLADEAAKLVIRHADRDRVIFSCFHPQPLLFLRDNYPNLKRAVLIGDHLLHWPFLSYASPQIFMQSVRTNIIHPRADQINERFMDQAKARNWTVYAWSSMQGEESDREGLWSALSGLGVDGLCTNYPRELITWLKEAKNYEDIIRKPIH